MFGNFKVNLSLCPLVIEKQVCYNAHSETARYMVFSQRDPHIWRETNVLLFREGSF